MYNITAKKIVIPEGTKQIDIEEFKNFENVEEIVLPNSIEVINMFAFAGCKSLRKINLPNNLRLLEPYAFAGCESLEKITIPSSLKYLSAGVFRDCKKLKRLNIHNNINYIDEYALNNCESLEDFDIPSNVTSLGQMALMGCKKIKVIHIPANLDTIEVGALALMDSLELIAVDENNEKYFTEDDGTVLVSKDGIIIQYAINCDRQEFASGYYIENYGEDENHEPIESYQLIYNIADYAFAGAKKLHKIFLPSETESIGTKTFAGCDNLIELEVYYTSYGKALLFTMFGSFREEADIPFEKVIIPEGVTTLCENMSDIFKNAKEVVLPSTLEHIGKNVFSKSKYLTKLDIPKGIKMINPNTFEDNILLNFSDFGIVRGIDFNMLQTKTSDDYYIEQHDKDNIRIFALNDGTYYVKIDDYDIVKVNRDEIIKMSDTSFVMKDDPDKFIEYLCDLLHINRESSSIMMGIWTDKRLEETFSKFVNDMNCVRNIAEHKTSTAIREIINNSGIYDEFLFSGMMMKKMGLQDIKKILENYNNSISRFFRLCRIDENQDYDDVVINVDNLIEYCKLLEKYKKYDKFLYNPIFFQKLSHKNAELLIKHFNKNIKHILQNSETLSDRYGNNLNDLITFCNALGVFSDDTVISQRLSTFINEKILSNKLPNGKENEHRIVGNDIHTMFGEIKPRDEIDYEFIALFIENYDQLVELEKQSSGIIARIYNAFRDISKTSTSHRGSQRHLKVTLDKCLDYFLTQKFEAVTEENKDLATKLQSYYSESYALSIGEMIVKQSQDAPRNVFSKINYNEDGNPIYSYDENEDLYEKNLYGFSYHWLPKQDYDNLILGKYCNCCAHILGAGAGIMRASMILDNCQNFVIRNIEGEIIAKMTIYVNREQGYAVFNTAEVNSKYHSGSDLNEIYEAFMRGVNRFVDEYNKNNIIPISIVSIGEYRNVIKYNLGNEETRILDTPNYSTYGYYAGGQSVGTYDGDAKNKQLLVLKRQKKGNLAI